MHQLGRTFSRSTMSRTNSSLPAQRGNETAATRIYEGTSLMGHGVRDTIKKLDQDDRVWVRWPMNFIHTAWDVLSSNYANVLLVFVPVGIIAGATGWDPVAVFFLNFLAIIPLAALLAFTTEELSAKLGQTIGGLMNATFGNAVELIVSIIALREGQIRIVQSSMLGSILSNILLVSFRCFSLSIKYLFTDAQQRFWAAASLLVAFTISSRALTLQSRKQCLPSWLLLPPPSSSQLHCTLR